MISALVTLTVLINPAKADDTANEGLADCAAAFDSCQTDRDDAKGLFKLEHAANLDCRSKLTTADETIASQAAGIPGPFWALGGGAAVAVVLAVLGAFGSKK